jgi:hypothetical protein
MALLIKKFQLSGTSRFCVPVIIGKHFTDFCFWFFSIVSFLFAFYMLFLFSKKEYKKKGRIINTNRSCNDFPEVKLHGYLRRRKKF